MFEEVDVKKLIMRLESLKNQGYIFRGQADAGWELKPNAFRGDGIAKNVELYPVAQQEIEQKWFANERIEVLCTRNLGHNKQHRLVFRRILQLYIYVMQYNYALYNFFNSDRGRQVAPEIRSAICPRNQEWWAEEETFIHILFNTALLERWFTLYDFKGKIIQQRTPDEILTVTDETFPQHYDIPTAALDWSFNPSVAIYFAANDGIELDQKTGLYIAKRNPEFLSVFAYKQLKETEDMDIFQMGVHPSILNERARAQEGTFTYFKNPSTFYVDNNRFPSFNDFVNSGQGIFDLQRFNVKCNEENKAIMANHLEEVGITKDYLKL